MGRQFPEFPGKGSLLKKDFEARFGWDTIVASPHATNPATRQPASGPRHPAPDIREREWRHEIISAWAITLFNFNHQQFYDKNK